MKNKRNTMISFSLTQLNSDMSKNIRLDGTSDYASVLYAGSLKTGITLIAGSKESATPTEEWYLIISAGDEATRCQLAVNLFYGNIYWRYCAAGKWSEWVKKI